MTKLIATYTPSSEPVEILRQVDPNRTLYDVRFPDGEEKTVLRRHLSHIAYEGSEVDQNRPKPDGTIRIIL